MQASAKGSIVIGAVASLRHHRSSGRISKEALQARLSRSALELLEEKIDIGRWYPMSAFAELVDCEWDLVAGRDPEYARQAGASPKSSPFISPTSAVCRMGPAKVSRMVNGALVARRLASARGRWRSSASITASVCSAAAIEFGPGVFSTTMPRSVAAGTSILSVPTPARVTTRSRVPAASTSAVTFVSLRTISAS